jgi:hypothetical protein
MKKGESMKRERGCQTDKLNRTGRRTCQSKTLNHARNVPPTAINQAERKSLLAQDMVNIVKAVRKRIKTVRRINIDLQGWFILSG